MEGAIEYQSVSLQVAMMNDKQLADAVRLAGWLRDDGVINAPWGSWTPGLHKHTWQDWQLWVLAGAVEEMCIRKGYRICSDITGCEVYGSYTPEIDMMLDTDDVKVIGRGLNQDIVRDRIEACVEALREDGDERQTTS
jgi:hypothetical protein